MPTEKEKLFKKENAVTHFLLSALELLLFAFVAIHTFKHVDMFKRIHTLSFRNKYTYTHAYPGR